MVFDKDTYTDLSMKENDGTFANSPRMPSRSTFWKHLSAKAKRPLEPDITSFYAPVKKPRSVLDLNDSPMKPSPQAPEFVPNIESKKGGRTRHLKMAGPEKIQTLRGQLLGREVALIFCGESHHDAIDLTRSKSKVEAEEGWVRASCDSAEACCFNTADAFKTKEGLTLAGAKKWASKVLADLGEDQVATGAHLVFDAKRTGSARARGAAHLFLPGTKHNPECALSSSTTVFQWADLDEQARLFNQRRADVKTQMSVEEQDSLIEERKQCCLAQGIELFDDWLIRQSKSEKLHVNLILEGPIAADEVELHVEEGMGAAPLAEKRLREMEPDSDEDSDRDALGNGSYLDTVRRRVAKDMPRERVHCIDPRLLGDADDENLPAALQGSFKALETSSPPEDLEETELKKLGLHRGDQVIDADTLLPSWEAFFGGAADLLYYAPHVKADYTPFLANCVGSPDKLKSFFQSLFFGTVPEALTELNLDKETRPSAAIRSLLCQTTSSTTSDVMRRAKGSCRSGRTTIPVKSAPFDRYLKARGSNPPRTWVSGLAQRLEDSGASDLVAAAQAWYMRIVTKVLNDPKGADPCGDNFGAWLRAAHRSIYDDIDTDDLEKLNRVTWACSKRNPKSKDERYNLKDISIPGLQEAFMEFKKSRDKSQPSSSRERCLSQIIVDSFSLRSVDLAMVLKTADIAVSAPEGAQVVVVIYAGSDHTRSAAKFWCSQGFSNNELPNKGLVGKDTYDDDEPRCLKLPTYLHELDKLFTLRSRTKIKKTMGQSKKTTKSKMKSTTRQHVSKVLKPRRIIG
eukprot:gnl/MRDRNA2_/MRDRNA2_106312_c0_seq1.p1 gnl/MRDRNA2_/MRDRNA2_106312_c0~~gnl/MRDRNA2_/MRDRNA2_106312_c0_seq1.p1  ORF type:complete len:844 (+),score=147.29 gnl/MRDRNA2_/MRDRNA2_106312_c0_seq1:135-2534(+)